jgi:hypothetical protein
MLASLYVKSWSVLGTANMAFTPFRLFGRELPISAIMKPEASPARCPLTRPSAAKRKRPVLADGHSGAGL